MIYFDSAATTLQKPQQVYEAAYRAMKTLASPGRGGYAAAMRADEALYECRALAGTLFDAQADRIVFTMNATHALNLAIKTLVRPCERVVISGFEHNAVVRPLYALSARRVVAGTKLFDREDTLQAFREAVTPQTAAVICTHVSNVFGYVLPVQEIADLCYERGVPFVLDASQSAGMLPVSMKKLRAAFIAMPGHKGLYGAQGTGILVCGRLPQPLLEGGTGSVSEKEAMPTFLPDRAEAGTQNVCGICALREGLKFVLQTGVEAIAAHEDALRAQLAEALREIAGATVFESDGGCQSGVLSFLLPQLDSEQVARKLAEAGICVRAGLHCAPLAHKSAGTIGTGSIRASFSALNTAKEAEIMAEVCKKL